MMNKKTKRALQIAGLGLLTCATALLPVGCMLATRDSVQVGAVSSSVFAEYGGQVWINGLRMSSTLMMNADLMATHEYTSFWENNCGLQFIGGAGGLTISWDNDQLTWWITNDDDDTLTYQKFKDEYILYCTDLYDEDIIHPTTDWNWTIGVLCHPNRDNGIWFSKGFKVYSNATDDAYPIGYYVKGDPWATTGSDLFNQGYQSGFDNGERQGKAQGDQEGYQRGYTEGVRYGETHSALGPTGTIGGLLLTIVSVPLTILNGFEPFQVYQIPLMTILLSFVFIGLVIWIIRKFI